MFQRKVDKICRELSSELLWMNTVGYDQDNIDNDATLCRVPQIYKKENLKLNKDKYHFRCMIVPFFGEIISRCEVQYDLYKLHVLTEMLPCK